MRNIAAAILIFSGLLFAGCNDTDILDEQRSAIERYLTGKDYVTASGVYKQTVNADREYPPETVMIDWGDSVEFMFAAYQFGTTIAQASYFTNMANLLEGNNILNQQYWPLDPKAVKVGDGQLVKGLENGLLGSREADSVWLYLTSDLCYGKKTNGLVPKDTPTAWLIVVDKVTKQN